MKDRQFESESNKCALCEQTLPKKGFSKHHVYGKGESNVVVRCHAVCHRNFHILALRLRKYSERKNVKNKKVVF